MKKSTIFPFYISWESVASVTVFSPEGQRVRLKIPASRGASCVGDLDIALLNAVVSALARAAQWQQAQCRGLRFIVVLCGNSYPSWESTWRIIPGLVSG